MMALMSILVIVMLVAVTTGNGKTGMASGYNIPHNECTSICQMAHGPGWIGVPQGKYGNSFNHCICKDSSYLYRQDDFYR